MAKFDFSGKAMKPSSTGKLLKGIAGAKITINTNKADNRNRNFKIVEKDVSGVVGITLDASFFVRCNGKSYPIAYINYQCGKRRIVYSRFLDKNKRRIQYIREIDRRFKHILHYLPFAPGLCVDGNIVVDTLIKKEVFRIKKIYIDWDNKLASKELKFFQDFYNIIIRKYKQQLYGI